ncbi:hypothetical protein J6590_026003 [Homalodisca vitripennis]|nr:hypothetical protein J6590_026003 [Homalodisca vitripennis]
MPARLRLWWRPPALHLVSGLPILALLYVACRPSSVFYIIVILGKCLPHILILQFRHVSSWPTLSVRFEGKESDIITGSVIACASAGGRRALTNGRVGGTSVEIFNCWKMSDGISDSDGHHRPQFALLAGLSSF